jgi:O-antigen ligase
MGALTQIGRTGLAVIALSFVALLGAVSTMEPVIAVGIIGATAAFTLAYRSPAIPLGVVSSTLFYVAAEGRLPAGGTTLLVTSWLIGGVVLALARRDPRQAPLASALDAGSMALVILAGLVVVGTTSSLAPEYASVKSQLFVVEGLVPFAAGLVVALARRRVVLFVRILAAGGVLTSFYGVYLLLGGGAVEANQDRFTISQQVNPIGFARAMAETLLVLLVLTVDARTPRTRVVLGLAAVPVVVAMLGAGSRGPMIGLVAAVIALIAIRSGSGPAFRRLVGAVAAMLMLGVVAVALVVPPETAGRALSIFTGKDESGDSATRFELWGQALAYLPDSAWGLATGVGTGSFAALSPDEDYPHNIILEVLLEQGLVGFIALVVFLWLSLGAAWRLGRLPGDDGRVGSLVFAGIVFAFVAAMFSGDIGANGGVFLWAGITAGMVAQVRAARSVSS